MRHAYLGTLLSKAALPIAGAALALIVSLSVALWWTNNRLSAARDDLAASRADTLEAVRANQRAMVTISELTDAAERNRTQREDAIRRQQEALDRIAKLERERREQTTDTIERVVRIADGDACAGAAIPDRLRDTARGDGDGNGNS